MQRPSISRYETPAQSWLAKHAFVQTSKLAKALFLSVVSITLLGPGTWPQKAWNPGGGAAATQIGAAAEVVCAVPEDEDIDAGKVKVCAGVVCPED